MKFRPALFWDTDPQSKNIMDTASQKVTWHYETLPRSTKKALDFLSQEKWLEKSKWYLAGGTALALFGYWTHQRLPRST